MKIAIVGAGISGLSCAFELKKHGITPVIYEKNNYIGDILDYASIWSRQFSRPAMDPVKYLRTQYQLKLTPFNDINKIVLHSANRKAVQRGSLGYIFKRGREPYSLENQIAAHANVPVLFDSYIDIDSIKHDYDHIVVATANDLYAYKLGIWTETFNSHSRNATVLGRFNPKECLLWMNKAYAKSAFCYLIPNSEKEASLVLIVNGITHCELDYYWKAFLFTEDIRYRIVETKDTEYNCGFVSPHRVGNLYFVGNAGGFTDDLIGCGAFNAIESGIIAAKAIIDGLDYDRLVAPIYQDIMKLHELRKSMNSYDNAGLDRLITVMKIPILKHWLYNNPGFRMSQLAPLARRYNAYIRKHHPVR